MKLKYRRSLSFCILFCLLTGSATVYDLASSYRKEQEETLTRLANASYLVAEWIKGAMLNTDYVLRDIVSQVPVTELRYPPTDPARQAEVTALIDAKRKTLPNAAGVGLNDEHCIITHTNAQPGVDASRREWCQAMLTDPVRETYVSHMYRSLAGRLAITQVRRFPGAPGSLSGLAGIAVDLEFFSKWLAQVPTGPQGTVLITDTWLNLLAHKPDVPERLGLPVPDADLKAFLASSDTYTTFHSGSLLDDTGRLYGARKVDGLPFLVVFGEADTDWTARWRQRAWAETLALLLIWVMAALLLREYWALLRQQEVLAALANTDELAGIANRRHFMFQAEREFRRALRHSTELAVLMLDIDYFKQINDNHGHATGDRAIIAIAQACQRVLRDIDLLGRLGGDEFVVLLPDTDRAGALAVADRLRREIGASTVMNEEGEELSMTPSVGLCMVGPGASDVQAAIAMADVALYRAKALGRNRVEIAGGLS